MYGNASPFASRAHRASHLYNDDMAIKFVLVNGSEKLNLDTLAKATGVNGPCGANACFAADEIESCGGNVLDRNKFVTGQIVGADNFDIGHFGSGAGSGGVAYLGVVGGADKAGGCTALDTPDGDFYAVDFFAHEVGHHVQNLLGITGKVDAMRGRVSEVEQNALSVRVELQADCFAGVWAHDSQKSKGWLDNGDIEEALNAASHIGDDTLQR
eukprot:gene1875-2198_t